MAEVVEEKTGVDVAQIVEQIHWHLDNRFKAVSESMDDLDTHTWNPWLKGYSQGVRHGFQIALGLVNAAGDLAEAGMDFEDKEPHPLDGDRRTLV